MRLSQIAHTAERIVRLAPLGNVDIDPGKPVRLSITPAGVNLHEGTRVEACELLDDEQADWLELTVTSGAYIGELLSIGGARQDTPSEVVIRLLVFDSVRRWAEGLEVGVDDTTVDDVNRLRESSESPDRVIEWLRRELTVEAGEPLAVLSPGGGQLDDHAFRLLGASITTDVRLHGDRLIISRVSQRPRNPEGPLVLARGQLSVVDATRMGQLSTADRQEVRRLAEADNAYLAIWQEYNKLERDAARQAARDIGWADYDRFHVLGDGTLEFELVQHPRSDTLRERIGGDTVGLDAASGVAFNEDTTRDTVIGMAWVTPRGTIRLRPDKPYLHNSLPMRGMLSGAFTLDKIRISRRETAQSQIARGTTAPARQIGLGLADRPLDPVGRVRRHDPLSHRVRTILGGEPTEAQVQAIDLAINSRDIALIQGPPGTGKTRVIAAIQARLTELRKDEPALNKRVLLTSYQHDAVANLIQAADDGNLPPIKLGRAEGLDDETYLVAWTNDLQTRLTRRYENLPPNKTVRSHRALVDRTNAYRQQPFDVTGTIELLSWLGDQHNLVGGEVALEARRLARRYAQTLGARAVSGQQSLVFRLARRLRTTAESFSDDGVITARQAFESQSVFDLLADTERRTLETAARGQLPPTDAAILIPVKRNLLDRLLNAKARATVVATMPAVEALLERALREAEDEVARSTTAIDRIVERFRDAVDHQPAAIRQSLQAHTRALAATCQQSVSGAMREAQSIPFDTVIVDEAARANPLDLMVPLALAKERVVLVGDHRQLPQLLDDTLLPMLSSRHDPDVISAVLHRSLFERLFLKLREAENRGDTKRVVTLDRQFRTHPVLGTFISEQFYAPYGETLSNANPDPIAFEHHLPSYGRAACGWIDVPAASGPEQETGTSISRPVEAVTIVRELASGLQDSADLTFGVISFYAGQVTAIWEAMSDLGLAVRQGRTFDLNPSVPWLHTDRGLPRVRIGSVDAFQGREFDVVYLSTTRSSKAGSRRGSRFGFLVLPNRLCVAMSRQRRLLIAVGDASLMTSAEARSAVPALAAFHELTGGEYGFRRTA